MALLGIIAFLAVLAAIYGPQYWVGHTMRRHSVERPDFPGTGGEMAQHLVERFELAGVGVEATDAGDHYDPETRMVRLSNANFDAASLTAVAVRHTRSATHYSIIAANAGWRSGNHWQASQ
tara:strand:- start:8694 stop:9056 length:363 start_codon:yes stop_codon:yes gene_type:complete